MHIAPRELVGDRPTRVAVLGEDGVVGSALGAAHSLIRKRKGHLHLALADPTSDGASRLTARAVDPTGWLAPEN